MVIQGHSQSSGKVKSLSHTFPAEAEQGDTLPSCSSSQTGNKCPFHGLFSATFFAFLCFLSVTSLFRMAPKHSAQVLSGVPKGKKAGMCLPEKIRV